MGLWGAIIHGFGFTLGARAADKAITETVSAAAEGDDEDAERTKAETFSAKMRAKAEAEQARERRAEESEREIERELAELKKRVANDG